MNAGEILSVIKGEEYAGWGTSGAPGTRTINSIFIIVQDQNAVATPETFDVVLYPESTTPGTPDFSNRIVFATGVAGPAAPAAGVIAAAAITVTPAAPVSVPIQGSGDVFVGFVLPASAGWPATDGMSTNVSLGYAPSTAFTVFDTPGATQTPQTPSTNNNTHTSNVLSPVTAASVATLLRTRYQVLDVAHLTAGGVVLAITNQTSATGSNNPPPVGFGPAPGVAGFNSAVSPDVNGTSVGRVDDSTFDYFRGVPAAGNLVLFLADVGTFGPEVPLGLIFPGSTGSVCVNSTFVTLATGLVDPTGEAFNTFLIPAAARPLLAGLTLVQQAVELNLVSGVFHASPCGLQAF